MSILRLNPIPPAPLNRDAISFHGVTKKLRRFQARRSLYFSVSATGRRSGPTDVGCVQISAACGKFLFPTLARFLTTGRALCWLPLGQLVFELFGRCVIKMGLHCQTGLTIHGTTRIETPRKPVARRAQLVDSGNLSVDCF